MRRRFASVPAKTHAMLLACNAPTAAYRTVAALTSAPPF
jgi:hypothetical protein